MRKLDLFHATGIKDDEDFTGFVVRQAELSNVDSHRGVMELVGKIKYRPAFVHPVNVEALAELFSDLLPDWKRVVMEHTRYRLYSAFLSQSNQQRLLSHYRSGREKGALSLVGMPRKVLRGRLGICLSCIASDFEEHGFAIWHRIHLMPSILYCPTHEEPLMTFCPRCDISHRRAPKTWHPRERCLHGGPLVPIGVLESRDSVDAAVAIAKMAEEVLQGRIDTSALADNTGPVLRAKVRRMARALDRRDYHQVARESLESRLGGELIPLLGFTTWTFRRVTGHWKIEDPLRNPVQNVAAIWCFFGGWPDFLREVSAREANRESYDASAITPPKRMREHSYHMLKRWHRKFGQMDALELELFRDDCRAKILAAKTLNPEFLRSDILYLPDGRKLLIFATHYDTSWLDHELPNRAGKASLSKVIERNRRRDSTRVNLVLQRFEDTLRDAPYRFISRAFLLSGTGSESAYKRGRGTPELESILDRCADTLDSWRKRKIELVTSLERVRHYS